MSKCFRTVENAEQLLLLREMGCDLAQGYLIARPVAEPEYLQHLTASVEFVALHGAM